MLRTRHTPVATAAVRRCPRPALTAPQRRRSTHTRALLDAEIEHHDSWGLDSRSAMLGITSQQDFAALVTAVPAILTCDAACLFAMQQSAQLLGVPAPQLLLQAPELLNTPSTVLQQCIEELQQVLQLPQPAVVALLRSEPQVACGGRRALGGLLRRHCTALGLSGPEGAALLGWLLAALTPAAKLSDLGDTQQQVRELSGLLMLTPAELLAALRAEERAFGTAPLAEVLQASGEAAAAWSRLSEEVGVPQQEVMRALVQQLMTPEPRYSLRSAVAVAADLARLQAACQLAPGVLLRMLLAAPALVAVPDSFWGLLFQYCLFLMPHWRQQLDAMPAAEAAAMIVELFQGSASDDLVPVSAGDSLFATADSDFSQELRLLAALLDQGTPAPSFASERHIRAGRVWRLIYLCNPRISAIAQSQHDSSSSSSSASPWSWVAKLQLPAALMQQLQQRGALQCELPEQADATNNSTSAANRDGGVPTAGARSRAACVGEVVEGLAEVVAAPTQAFIARHPGYSHWLHHTMFELEWSSARAAVPIQTWDC